MPSKNVTIDDVSALIQYAPIGDTWKDSPTTDPSLGSYYGGTYHSSNTYGASASFQFDGTAVYLYAAKRLQHGQYVIHLDGQIVYNTTGQSNTSFYKQVMYNTTNLSPGTHVLNCTNADPTNQTYTEVDYIVWTTSMNSSLTESTSEAISISNMTYSSSAAWSQDQDVEPMMVTATDGASVTINFSGNGIELNGRTGPKFGAFSAQVDNNDARQLNARSEQTHTTLLFRQDNLSSGNHSLVVTNRGGGFTSLSIGSATPIIWSTDLNSSNDSSNSSSHTSHAGAIAGAVVGVVLGLAALLLLVLWLMRQRRRTRKGTNEELVVVRPAHEPAFLDATPFVLPAQGPPSQRESRIVEDHIQGHSHGGPSVYHAVPGSPGMSSRGSFEYGQAGAGSSSGATTSAGWGAVGASGSALLAAGGRGKERKHSGPTARHEIDEDSLRDRDAGPVLLPQLPPAYSSTAEPVTNPSQPMPASNLNSNPTTTPRDANRQPGLLSREAPTP